MSEFVLDAWALMAWLKGQAPAAERVRLLLTAAERREHRLTMNIVNLGEVFYLSAKAKNLEFAERVMENLRPRLTVVSATDELVMRAASLKSRHAISYADAFAAATALVRGAPLVTGDPELRVMAERDKSFQVEWLGA
jgi:predicted nucleic acid-binding protein